MFHKIKKELEKLNIGIVYVFGSRAQGLAKKDSDIDIGIVFSESVENTNLLLIYEKLYSLFLTANRKQKGEIDIVFLQSASLALQFNAIKYGKVVYEISSKFKASYEEKIMLLHSDFEPLAKEFDEMVLARI
jgi:predicted nucleotidyltransferase